MSKTFVVGIDIGGTNTRIAGITEDGMIFGDQTIHTAAYFDPEKFTLDLINCIKNIIKINHKWEMRGIGLGAPCVNIETERIENASNLNWKVPLNLCEAFKNEFSVPVKITNDANLFALGEKNYGKNKSLKDFIIVTLGTGVGSGIICNGKLLQGRDGLAAEIGHIIVEKNGRKCLCGRRGCLETYCSATGATRTALDLMSSEFNVSSSLNDIPSLKWNPKIIADAANEGDPIAIKTYEITGLILGEALANLAVCFNPEIIFLAGGMTNAGDLILKPVMESFNANLPSIYPKETPIAVSSVQHDGAVLGAAALIWDYLKSEQYVKSETTKNN